MFRVDPAWLLETWQVALAGKHLARPTKNTTACVLARLGNNHSAWEYMFEHRHVTASQVVNNIVSLLKAGFPADRIKHLLLEGIESLDVWGLLKVKLLLQADYNKDVCDGLVSRVADALRGFVAPPAAQSEVADKAALKTGSVAEASTSPFGESTAAGAATAASVSATSSSDTGQGGNASSAPAGASTPVRQAAVSAVEARVHIAPKLVKDKKGNFVELDKTIVVHAGFGYELVQAYIEAIDSCLVLKVESAAGGADRKPYGFAVINNTRELLVSEVMGRPRLPDCQRACT